VVHPINQEVVTIRGIISGEYIVNLHYYCPVGLRFWPSMDVAWQRSTRRMARNTGSVRYGRSDATKKAETPTPHYSVCKVLCTIKLKYYTWL